MKTKKKFCLFYPHCFFAFFFSHRRQYPYCVHLATTQRSNATLLTITITKITNTINLLLINQQQLDALVLVKQTNQIIAMIFRLYRTVATIVRPIVIMHGYRSPIVTVPVALISVSWTPMHTKRIRITITSTETTIPVRKSTVIMINLQPPITVPLPTYKPLDHLHNNIKYSIHV